MNIKTKRRYLTRTRRQKIMTRKGIVIVAAILIGIAVIGYHEQQLTKIIDSQTLILPAAKAQMESRPMSVEEQIRTIAKNDNFRWPDYLVRLAYCESRFNSKAVGDNGSSRGLFQIHRGYHPEVSDVCAFDAACATRWTMQRINAGYQREWACDKLIK